MSAAAELIPKIIDSITQALPELAQTGSQMINSLIEGLANTLPTLISSVITIVATIAKTILENNTRVKELVLKRADNVTTEERDNGDDLSDNKEKIFQIKKIVLLKTFQVLII